MVSAWWLLLAASAGVGVGMLLTALLTMVTAGNADVPDERAAHPLN